MANRVYLCCTDFQDFPTESQFDDFFKVSGTEYEANWAIPLFWLCLFSSADIRILPANHNRSDVDSGHEEDELDDDEFDDESRAYAYLFCSRSDGIERLKRRAGMLKKTLGDERYALYCEWTARMETETFHNILVRTEELDVMGAEGELEGQLREALEYLESSHEQEGFRMIGAISNIAGLQEDMNLARCEGFALVGSANGPQRWPPSLTTKPSISSSQSSLPPQKKSKWLFWK
ncbi:hypothetical protein [Herbaspirillum hiltneri]|uniref:hypothetical protein n=1 Tax=Herbaspirillum hiltneri TaxID=341045 RepID=UPI000B17C435|nr:hypothetical protein [Herbaspirillum hiltneri]